MNSASLLSTVSELSVNLGELDSDIADLKFQLRSFAGDLADDEAPSVLPEDFDPVKWRGEIDNKLLERLKTAQKLEKATEQFESTRKAELDKAFADIEKRYRQTIVTMLKAAVTFGRALRDAENVRDAARQLKGNYAYRLQHIGPTFAQFDLNDRSSFMGHWIAEAKRAGYIDGSESWLAGIPQG